VFVTGVKCNFLDEAMLPLLAKLTSRRLGLLTYLQGSDYVLHNFLDEIGCGIEFGRGATSRCAALTPLHSGR
jgi:hypothetical protein